MFGKSPREISRDITDGKIPPQHIGPKSFKVRVQELASHVQNYQETFSNAEKKAWLAKLDELKVALRI